MSVVAEIELVARKVRDGFVFLFHAAEHELPMVLTTLVNVYGPDVVAHAVATYKGNLETYATQGAGVAEADLQALVQSSVVQRFGLPPTAAQFIASGIHHLFTIGEAKMVALIESGAAKITAATSTTPTAATGARG